MSLTLVSRRKARLAALTISTALIPAAAFAQADDETEDLIIVTGSGIATTETDALQAVDILSAGDLERAFDGSLGATLADLPGLSTTNFGPAVGRPVIRGLGGDRVRILNNSIGLIDASTVSTDHALTSEGLEADRVEVLRGAAAIPYGGNAIGGVINVIDGSIPSQLPDAPLEGRLFVGATSVDNGRQVAGRVRTAAGPIVFQLEGLDRQAQDLGIPGFAKSSALREIEQEEDPSGFDPGPEKVVTNSDFGFEVFGGGASVVGDWGYLGASLRNFDAFYGLPLEDEDQVGIEMEQTRLDVNGQVATPLGPFHTLTFAGGWVDYEHGEFALGELATLFENDGHEVRAALVNGGNDNARWSGSVGVQYAFQDFSAQGSEDFIPPAETTSFGVFGSQRYDLGGYGFEGGLRYETRDIEPIEGEDLSFSTVSASAGAFVRPAQGFFLGASLSRTERAPTNAELYSNGFHPATGTVEIGEPDLEKETALSIEAVANYQMDGTSLEAAVFATDFADFIFLAGTGEDDLEAEAPIFQYFQDDAQFYGVEVQAVQRFTEVSGLDLVGDVAFEYVSAKTDNLGNVPYLPPLSTIVGINLEAERWQLRADVEHVFDAEDQADFELPTDGYTFLGVRAVFEPAGAEGLRVIVAAENLTDEEARLNTSQLKDIVPLAGRNFRVNVSYAF